MFDPKSRYAGVQTFTVEDHRGRTVVVVSVPEAPHQTTLGVHRRLQGQRLDHLAAKYLGDTAGYWRICELNGVMLPDALAEANEILIPRKAR